MKSEANQKCTRNEDNGARSHHRFDIDQNNEVPRKNAHPPGEACQDPYRAYGCRPQRHRSRLLRARYTGDRRRCPAMADSCILDIGPAW